MTRAAKKRTHDKLVNEVVKHALALWHMRETTAQKHNAEDPQVQLARKGYVNLLNVNGFSEACYALEKFEAKPACREKPVAIDPEARARARAAAKKPCHICCKATPKCDRAVYLAHGNGGAYGCAPAHKACVELAIALELPVTSWNEEEGWYVRGDTPSLSDVRR